MQSPVPGKEEPLAAILARDWLPWEQFCWKGLEDAGGHSKPKEQAMYAGSKGRKQYPGLH